MLKNYVSAFNFIFLIAILIFLSVMTDNQMKCGIIYKKIVMQVGDGEQMISFEWLNILVKV